MGRRRKNVREGEKPAPVFGGRTEEGGIRGKHLSSVLLLAAAVLLAYVPALNAGYVWDDPEYLLHNPVLEDGTGLGRIWFGIHRAPGEGFRLRCETPQYYPLVFTSFWIQRRIHGLHPFGYHLVNVLLHLGAALLFWRALWRLGVPGALFAAGLFALHPVCVESVAWVTERKNVLSLFFYLAAGLAYLRSAGVDAVRGEETLRKRIALWFLSFFLFLCALASKTVTSTLPAALVVLLWWKRVPLRRGRTFLPLVPFFLAGVLGGLLTAVLEETHVGASGAAWSLALPERFVLAGRIPWFYLGKLLLPLHLSFVYPRWNPDGGDPVQYLPLAALLAGLGVLFFLARRGKQGPLAAALFFLVSLFPALGFFAVYPMRFSFVADHFQYLASLGFFAVAGAAGAAVLRKAGIGREGGRILAMVVVCVLGLLTWNRGPAFADAEALWRDTLSKNPEAWIAHSNLAEILVARGRLDEAIRHCRAALRLHPGLAEARGNLANALFRKGRYEEALRQYGMILERDPGNVKALNNRGATLEALGRWEEAEATYRTALRLAPGYGSTHYNLANLLVKDGRTEEAADHYARALEGNPSFFQARLALGRLLLEAGRKAEALPHLEAAAAGARAAGADEDAAEAERLLKTARRKGP